MPDGLTTTAAAIGLLPLLAMSAALLLASVLRAFTGFGFALAAVPALSLFVAPTEAVVLSSGLTLCANLFSVNSYRHDYAPLSLLPLTLASLLATALGVWFLGGLSTAEFQLWVGPAVLLACVVLSVYRPRPQPPRIPVAVGVGLLSGLMNGAFAIPGPPVIIYAMATEHEPRRSRAMLMYFFLFSSVIALALFAGAGYVTARIPALFLLMLPAMLVGDQLGQRLFRRYGASSYRRLALVLLYAIGAAITVRGLLAWLAAA